MKFSRVAVVAAAVVLVYLALRQVRGSMALGNVDSAIVRVRTICAVEAQFSKTHPQQGYTCAFSQLPPSEEITRLLERDRIDNGYVFEILGCEAAGPDKRYHVTARPLHSGEPAFCSDQSGIVRSDAAGSVENCLARGTPL